LPSAIDEMKQKRMVMSTDMAADTKTGGKKVGGGEQ